MVNVLDPDWTANEFDKWWEETKEVREKQESITIPDVLDLLELEKEPEWHGADWDNNHTHTGFINENHRDMTIRLDIHELKVEMYDKTEDKHWVMTASVQDDGLINRDEFEREPDVPKVHQAVVVHKNQR